MIHPQLNSIIRLTAVIALVVAVFFAYFMPQDNNDFKMETENYQYQHTTLGRAHLSTLFF